MLFTIGHSSHPAGKFIKLLRRHDITAVADVRSHPYSRHVPQYSREALKVTLADAGIAYVFLGRELGARSPDPACYVNGRVQYERLAQQPEFAQGLRRVAEGMKTHRVALMCAEKDPLNCHRTLLIGRKLHEAGVEMAHIHADATLELHTALESRLLQLCNLPEGDMFKSRSGFVAQAYAVQGKQMAFQNKQGAPT